jgi:4-hydroxythreonine-4-phosphate dehydrogenase
MTNDRKPLLAITMGDATGSGPEIITKVLAEKEINASCRPLVIGDAGAMREAYKITGVPGEVRPVDDVSDARFQEGTVDVLDLKNIDLSKLVRARVDPMAGKAAYEYIKLGAELNMAGRCDALVTSAINKDALNRAGYHYDGHTGLLSELCGAPDVTMLLVAGKLRVAHVSTHIALREAIDRVRPERLLTVFNLANDALRDMGIEEPRLVVAGLNPHASEDGLFGDEEEKYIIPAIEEGRRQGLNMLEYPLPPDTIFFRTLEGQFDAAIAMYHDQGHIAFKTLGIFLGVNITLGLPIIRTSVDHGTNFGKAGKGTADPRSLIEAINLAVIMCHNRTRAGRAT